MEHSTGQQPQNLCKHGVPHPEGHSACDGCCTKGSHSTECQLCKHGCAFVGDKCHCDCHSTEDTVELRTRVYNLVKEVHIQKPFEDVSGEPHYVTDEIMKIITSERTRCRESDVLFQFIKQTGKLHEFVKWEKSLTTNTEVK